ncbi:hypothetical protein [Streptomyces sp. NPDC018833]|uniref:hypothetical protein n=1 Tax=Streptomyces sp. NPDC018833 TaxID=3365053 RepID=UPI003788FFB8
MEVIIRHPNGQCTHHAHLNRALYNTGDRVPQGRTIGWSAPRERPTGHTCTSRSSTATRASASRPHSRAGHRPRAPGRSV